MKIMNKKKDIFPALPLRDLVIYPRMIVPLFVGRKKSLNAISSLDDNNKKVVLMAQKSADTENPEFVDVYHTGTLGNILQTVKLPDGTVKILVEGLERVVIKNYFNGDDFISVEAEIMQEDKQNFAELEALSRVVLEQFEEYSRLSKRVPSEIASSLHLIEDYGKLADTVSSNLALKIEQIGRAHV